MWFYKVVTQRQNVHDTFFQDDFFFICFILLKSRLYFLFPYILVCCGKNIRSVCGYFCEALYFRADSYLKALLVVKLYLLFVLPRGKKKTWSRGLKWHKFLCVLFFQALNGLTEESSTDNLEFPLLTQSSLSSITQLLPFLRTLCCSFQAPPPSSQPAAHFPIAEYPAASSHIVLSRLEDIIENEFLDSMES